MTTSMEHLARKYIRKHKCTAFNRDGQDYLQPPRGYVFKSSGHHFIPLPLHGGGVEPWGYVVEELISGTTTCTIPQCDTCTIDALPWSMQPLL